MPNLVVDTSSIQGVLSLIKDGKILQIKKLPFGIKASQEIMPYISQLFNQCHIAPKDLRRIIVGNGPGSYTGLRVGAVVCKVLSYTNAVPLIGISSIKGFIPSKDGIFAVILDAKSKGFYVYLAKKSGLDVETLSKPFFCDSDELINHFQNVDSIITPSKEAVYKKCKDKITPYLSKIEELAPDTLYLYHLALKKEKLGDFSVNGELDIIYFNQISFTG